MIYANKFFLFLKKKIIYRFNMNNECIICFETYNDSTIKPNVLIPCGHTVCGKCLESINKCPKCRKNIEKTVINWDSVPSSICVNNRPSAPISSIKDQTDVPLRVSLHKYLVIDVEEKRNKLIKVMEAKKNENNNIVASIKSKIEDKANQKIEKILKKRDEYLRKIDVQDSKIYYEIEEKFQKNDIEKESNLLKDEFNGLQSNNLNDLNEIDKLKKKSDYLKNKIDDKIIEMHNIQIKFNIETSKSLFFESDNDDEIKSSLKMNQSKLTATDDMKTILINECKRLSNDEEPKRKLKYLEIDLNNIYEDPTNQLASLGREWVNDFEEWCLQTLGLSIELTILLKKNAKISNWPDKYKTKKLLKQNVSEFLELNYCSNAIFITDGMWKSFKFFRSDFGLLRIHAYIIFEHENSKLEKEYKPNVAFVIVTKLKN